MKALQLSRVDWLKISEEFPPLTPFGEEVEMTRGLLEDTTEECKATFKNDIVKVTIQVLYLSSTDVPAYSDTVYSETPLTVTLFTCPK